MQVVIEVVALDAKEALDMAREKLANEPEYGGAGPILRLIGMSADATRANPNGTYLHRVHLEVEDEPVLATCETHGEQRVIEGGRSSGFAGGGIYWTRLACGDVLVDESDDVRAAQ